MRSGFTLVELLVVLLVLGLAATLVAPAFLPPRERAESGLSEALRAARDAALRRAETVELAVAPSGRWTLASAVSRAEPPLAAGQLAWEGPGFTIVVSAVGTCGFDARSGAAAREIGLDPLTCEVRP